MSDQVERLRDLLPEFLLGTLPATEAAEVQVLLRSDAVMRAEADELAEALGVLAMALPPAAPPPSVWARLVQSIEAEEATAFSRFADGVAALFDVTVERARALLQQIGDPASWAAGPCEGVALFHLQGGPRVATADVGFVRLLPGVRFPHHEHGGDEEGLLIQGGYLDSDGQAYRAGDRDLHGPGSSHDFVALPDEPCVFAVVVFGGVRFENGFQL